MADGGADPPSAAPIATSAPGTVGSIRRPSRVTDFSGSAASVSATRTVLPIPPGPCTNTAASPCEESIAPRRRPFLDPADQGRGLRSRQPVGDGTSRAGLAHHGMLVPHDATAVVRPKIGARPTAPVSRTNLDDPVDRRVDGPAEAGETALLGDRAKLLVSRLGAKGPTAGL